MPEIRTIVLQDGENIYTEKELKEAIKQEREENAMICDALEKQYTDMYEKRDDKHYESLAISAEICRDKIRARSKE